MTPSRRPPLPICRGWPSSSETFSRRRTPVVRMRTRCGSSSKRRATSAAGSPQRTRMPRSRVSYSSTAPTRRRSEVALPPTATAWAGMVDLDPLEDVVDAVADLADLGRRGRVGGDQLVGEDAGADAPGAHRLDAAGNGAEDHLGRAAADVDDADLAGDRVAERLGRADEGEPPLLLVAEDLDRDAGGRGDRLRHLLAVAGLAHGRGGDGADRLRAELAGQPHLGRDDLADLVDLRRRDRPVADRAPC